MNLFCICYLTDVCSDVVTSLSLLVNIVNKLPESIKKLNAIKQFKLKDNPDTVSASKKGNRLFVCFFRFLHYRNQQSYLLSVK